MESFNLKSVDVWFKYGDFEMVVTTTLQEAFTLLSMPSFGNIITNIVPQYELSEMPKE